MRKLRALLFRLKGLVSKDDSDFADELESHLQMHIDDNLGSGMSPDEARRNAVMKLGGVDQTKEAYRDRATIPLLESLIQDLRFTLRQLRKNPAFTVTATAMVALGMGASVAIFAFVDAALIKPLPYRDSSRLLFVTETTPVIPRGACWIVIGTGCAILAASFMRKLLFGTPPWDVTTLVCVAVVLGASALLASFLLARRAASVDPIAALRAE